MEQTIQSVLNQDYKNIEYIIIDGGSTDGTVELLHQYSPKIDYWLSEPDKGIYDAMNKGLQIASGDYIGLINADDWYNENTVSAIVSVFQSEASDVVYGAMQMIENEKALFIKDPVLNLNKLKKGMLISHPTVFAKRKLYEKYGHFDTDFKIAADWDMMLRWWLHGIKFTHTDKVLANFRMGGISSVQLKNSFEEKYQIRKKYGLYTFFDPYYFLDKLKKLFPSEVLLKISLFRQSGRGK